MNPDDVEREIARRVEDALAERVKDPTIVIAAYQKLILAARKEIESKDQELAEMQPKADFADAVMRSDVWIEMSSVSKTLGLKGFGRNTIFELLRDAAIVRPNNEPYQEYVERGYFRMIEQSWTNEYTGMVNVVFKTVVSQKGLDFIRRLIEKEQA